MNRNTLIGIVCAAALALAAGYYFLYQGSPPPDATKPAEPGAPGGAKQTVRFPQGAPQLAFIQVQPVLAVPEPLIHPLNGRIAYDENYTARVSSPVAGRVVRIAAQPGAAVKKGEALLWLDSPDYAAAVADFRKSDAELIQKRRAFDRAKMLYEGEVLARKEYEAAEADLRQAEAEAERARLRLKNLASSGESHDALFALRAPFAGIVTERQANPGSEVRPDAPNPLFVISDPTHLWVYIDLPERDLDKVKPGQEVVVEVDAYPGERYAERFTGRVANIAEVLDPQTRRVQVRCLLDNPKRLLKPEMYARVTPLPQEGGEKVARVPNSALISQGLYNFVFVEKEPGVFEKRPVTLGLQGHDYSYVRQGLAKGDRVVVSGALLLNSELGSGG